MAFNTSENQAVISTGLSNSSRGVPSDDSLGVLFQGVGETLKNGLTAFDESTKVKIQMAADAAVNGPGGAVEGATPDAQGNLPAGAQAALGNIAQYKAALAQGAISQVAFDTRVAQEAKRIRASVPAGYGPMVESALSAAVGSSTANQARQTQMAAIDQLQRQASSEINDMKNWMQTEGVNGVLSTDIVKERFRRRTGGYTIDQMVSDPRPEFFDELQLSVSDYRKEDADYQAWKKRTEMGQHQTTEDVRLAADRMFQDSLFNNVKGPMFDYLQALSKFDPNTSGSDDYSQLVQMWAKVKTDAQMKLTQTFMETRASKEDRAALQAELDNIIKPFEDALTGKDIGKLNILANGLARDQDVVAKRLWGQSVEARASSALKKIGVPDQMTSSLWLGPDGQVLREASERAAGPNAPDPSLNAATSAAVATGEETFSDTVDMLGSTRKNPNAAVRGLMDNLSKILNSPVNTPEGVANAAVNIFSQKNQDMLNRIAPENRIAAFEQLLSPVVIKRLQESGNADALEFAQQWGTKQFDAVSKYAKDTVMDSQRNRLMTDITFDGKQFVWNPRNPTTGEKMTMLSAWEWEKAGAKEAYRAVSDLNRYIKVMEPLWAKDGMSPASALSMMQWEDVNKIGKAPTLMKTLGDAIWNSISTSSAEASIPKDEKPATNKELTNQTKDRSLVGYSRSIDPKDVQSTDQFLMSVLSKDKPQSYITGLDDGFAANISQLLQSAPPEIREGLGILSGARSRERQAQLWEAALKKYGSAAAARKWVAPPGSSMHNKGMAIDLAWHGKKLDEAPAWVIKWVHQNVDQYDLAFPLGNENWHIEPKGARKKKTQVASN